jgi:TolA-binding protein
MGRCLTALKRYKEAIVVFTNMIKNYPKDENLKEALFNIGFVYKLQGNKEKAALFFNKVLKMLPEGPVDRKAKKELSSIKS